MDSLARTLHFDSTRPSPVVTAVAVELPESGPESEQQAGLMTIAYNTPKSVLPQHMDGVQKSFQQKYLERYSEVKSVVTEASAQSAETKAERVANELAPTSGIPHSQRPVERLRVDLLKLHQTYMGADDQRLGGTETRERLQAAFHENVHWEDRTNVNGQLILAQKVVHAEGALIASGARGPIGVSRLSCAPCDGYARSKGRGDSLRGTHGDTYPDWVNPESYAGVRRNIANPNQFPSDSDSSPHGTSSGSPSSQPA